MSEPGAPGVLRFWVLWFWIAIAMVLVVVLNVWPDLARWPWGKPAAFGAGILIGLVMLVILRLRKKP